MQILCTTDGSELALLGAAFLAALPLEANSEIRLLSVAVASQTPEDTFPALDAGCVALRRCPARVTRCIREGYAAEEILHEAEAVPTDLIAVGMQGRSAVTRFFLGSTAEWVARHAHRSVLVARPLRDSLKTILVGIDGSQSAPAVLRFLETLPLPAGCRIHLVTVVFPSTVMQSAHHMLLPNLSEDVLQLYKKERADAALGLADASANLAGTGHRVTTEIRPGSAEIELMAVAEELQADLLVVGARGLSDKDRFLLGSVSERVLRHAPCSVLVVK